MTKKYKIIFNKDFDNEKAMESFKKLPLFLREPFFLREMQVENLDLIFEKIKLEDPKRFKILQEYIEKFKNEK